MLLIPLSRRAHIARVLPANSKPQTRRNQATTPKETTFLYGRPKLKIREVDAFFQRPYFLERLDEALLSSYAGPVESNIDTFLTGG